MVSSEIRKIPKYILDEKKVFNSRVRVFKNRAANLEKERQQLVAMREKIERDCAKHGLVFQFSG